MSSNSSTALACLGRIEELPALRGAVLDLLRSLDDPLVDVETLASKVASDQAMAVKALRLANSSFFGLARQVSSIADATAIIGLRSVRNIAMVAGLTTTLDGRLCAEFDVDAFWRHAIATALCAEALAGLRQFDAGVAFGFGLLHDIGAMAMAMTMPSDYGRALRLRRDSDALLIDAEREVLGITHAEVGAALAERWQLAPPMVAAIARHHTPPEEGEPGLLDLLHVADNIAHALDLSHQEAEMVPPLSMAAWGRLALSEAELHRVFEQTESRHTALCHALLVKET
ncbi:HDOD domain-containing protein [Paucibacter soli]|uniref:HDOD domain-containing protein n=1 Tax=Paucibacter soli TaxID=3133433 RepID=UPI003099E067